MKQRMKVKANWIRPNRYRRGLPHGHVHISFTNGDEYEGEMRNGMITGQGVLR